MTNFTRWCSSSYSFDGGAHFYDTYETKDGKYMAVGALEPKFYEELLNKLNLSDEELQHLNSAKSHEIFAKKFKEKTQKEWCEVR